ncbi:MAG: pyridoxamine 5'-phosphate oxidase family protein [Azoarcus sp.]|jgi:nitroimidazol reductase NimA-like FMN-containing flavoprotein (pyridoxamine 5'-phosphate oxidase superfamily)|nr:pyridoxamine 5'-phosphate oxidase family protein [Azoarcus sp.]
MQESHPLRATMRRDEREITDRAEIDKIIRRARLMRIALVDGERPFLVPVFYGYDGTSLYFHSARKGSKIEILKKNGNICFEISIDHGVIEDESPCDFEARHRTVIGHGKASFVTGKAEKIRALDNIVARFSDRKFTYPEASLNNTAVLRIDIEVLKGKKHGF